MIRIGIILLIFALPGCRQTGSESALWVMNDTEGEVVDLRNDPEYLVLMFVSTDCPLSQLYAKPFTALADSFPDFHFAGIVPGTPSPDISPKDFQHEYGFGLDLYSDQDLDLSEQLDARVTPQFFVIGPDKKILYTGAMDDWAIDLAKKKIAPQNHYLKHVLKDISAGNPVTVQSTKPVGCIIEYNE